MDAYWMSPKVKKHDLRVALGVKASTVTQMCKSEGVTGHYVPASLVRTLLEKRGFQMTDPNKIKTIWVAKGGTGKSTTSFYLANRAASWGAKILLVDTDPQGNCTQAFNFEEMGEDFLSENPKFIIDEQTPVIADVVSGKTDIEDAIIELSENLHLIPSHEKNSELPKILDVTYRGRAMILREKLDLITDNYDYIFIDCHPSYSTANSACILAADEVIMPINPDKFSKRSLEQSLAEIDDINHLYGIDQKVSILYTKYDDREKLSISYLQFLMAEYSDILMNSYIRITADLKNGIEEGRDIFTQQRGRGREDYDELARKVIGLEKSASKAEEKPESKAKPKELSNSKIKRVGATGKSKSTKKLSSKAKLATKSAKTQHAR